MRKSVTILLTLLLAAMILGIALAVPHGALQEDTVERHKDTYQPEEYDFLSGFGEDEEETDDGLDFGDEDDGIDFGDDD